MIIGIEKKTARAESLNNSFIPIIKTHLFHVILMIILSKIGYKANFKS